MHTLSTRNFYIPLLLACLVVLSGCASADKMENATIIEGSVGPKTLYGGKSVSSIQGEIHSGLTVPDGDGGVILVPGPANQSQKGGYVAAKELKLKVRELAEQLIADMADCSLQGVAALPTAFVHLDDFDQTSSFGRYLAEQLYYEFNQRGYPIREYRMPGAIRVKKQGEFILSRNIGNVSAKSPAAVVVVGTYYNDADAVFVNARLVRPRDGRVLRTASLVLNSNQLTKRMLRNRGGLGAGAKGDGTMRIRDFDRAVTPPPPPAVPQTPFDKGEDIH